MLKVIYKDDYKYIMFLILKQFPLFYTLEEN